MIGNAAYENAPALNNPVNDATDMCAALRRVGFKTLCHTNVHDRDEFDARRQGLCRPTGADSVGVFYYSGHGVQAGGANFLIPTQVHPKTVTEDPLRVLYGVDDLFDRLRQKPTKFQLVILDACRTDLFAAPRPVQRARAEHRHRFEPRAFSRNRRPREQWPRADPGRASRHDGALRDRIEGSGL